MAELKNISGAKVLQGEVLNTSASTNEVLDAETSAAEAWVKVPVIIDGAERVLYATDMLQAARELKRRGEAVVIYLHEGNREQDFSEFRYVVENLNALDTEYAEWVYRRFKGLPWTILETDRCVIRETTVEDVDHF